MQITCTTWLISGDAPIILDIYSSRTDFICNLLSTKWLISFHRIKLQNFLRKKESEGHNFESSIWEGRRTCKNYVFMFFAKTKKKDKWTKPCKNFPSLRKKIFPFILWFFSHLLCLPKDHRHSIERKGMIIETFLPQKIKQYVLCGLHS